MRTGIGYDIHRLVPTVDAGAIPLGGISIPCYFKVHSKTDGDVLLHALTDACLGALALGDIGSFFGMQNPNGTDEGPGQNAKVGSGVEMVREVVKHLHGMGWRIAQFDSVIIAEEPKISPHSDAIRRQVALLVGCDLHAISVKSKAMEGLGPIGERKAIAAHTVVTLERI